MQFDVDMLGYLAAACTTCAFVPQVVMVWRQRSASGISTSMYLVFNLGVFLWLCYGLKLGSPPIILANAITLVLALSVLLMKWHFERVAPEDRSL